MSRGVANEGRGRLRQDTKNREGEKKTGEGEEGERKGKRGKKEKKGRREKEKWKEKREEKRERKGKNKEREEEKGKRRGKRKKRKERGCLIAIMTRILPRSNHQIARIQFKNSKIFQLQTLPCARKRGLGANAPLGNFPNLAPWTVRPGYVPAHEDLSLHNNCWRPLAVRHNCLQIINKTFSQYNYLSIDLCHWNLLCLIITYIRDSGIHLNLFFKS